MPMISSGKELRKKRLARKLTQAKLAADSGVSQSLVARIEAGSVDPRLSTLKKISECLGERQRTAGDVMSKPVIFALPTDNVAHAAAEMSRFSISQMPVMDKRRQVGSLVDSRIVRVLASHPSDAGSIPISEVMGEPFPEVAHDLPLDGVYEMLEKNAAVLVVDSGVVRGIVSRADVLREIA
jgi:predicted transcriptional regulator